MRMDKETIQIQESEEKLRGAVPESGEELTLEEAFERLDEMMEALEDRETSLEDSFLIYQKGMELIRQCGNKIDLVEKKVLVMDEEGDISEF